MFQTNNRKSLQSIAVLSLCALFFLLAMGITLIGSSVYRNTIETSDKNYSHRTALSYLVNQVRRSDVTGGITLGSFGGSPTAIILTQVEGDTEYVTYLYCIDGQLRELYTETGLDMEGQDGVAILPLAAMEVVIDGNVLRLTVIEENGASYSTSVALRCALEEIL